MRALLLEVPEHFLEERRRLGIDVRDEMWEGVLHVVPQPLPRHQVLGADLINALRPAVDAADLVLTYETSLYRPDETDANYRVPDLMVFGREHVGGRGIEGPAELVVEIRSPGDETYDKLPFYARMGCRQVLVIDRDTLAVELFEGTEPVEPGHKGFSITALGVTIEAIDGPALRVRSGDQETLIRPL